VEQAPFAGPPALQLRPEAAGAPIHERPGGGQVVGRLADTRIGVRETLALRLEPTQPGYQEHCRLFLQLGQQAAADGCQGVLWGAWARAATSAGQDGWVLLQVNPEGE
jgi:hypothetical protein